MLELNCTNEQKIPITVAPVSAGGNPAQLDGAVVVSILAGEGSVQMVDNLHFFVVSGPNPGDTSYMVEADADLGAGVVTIQDTITLHVAGALAANLGLVAGPPEVK